MRTTTTLGKLLALVTVAYPLLVYFGLRYVEPRILAGLLASILALRLTMTRNTRQLAIPVFAVGLCFFIFVIWQNNPFTLRLYPVLVNAVMLVLFVWSLWSPQSAIERIARLHQPDLPPPAIVYTRRVTQVWSAFFLVNGIIAAITALWADIWIWSMYNGLIAYVLMGLLFTGEYMIRLRVRAQRAER